MNVERYTLCLALLLCAGACAQTGPANLDLEEREIGQTPAGWFIPAPSQQAGYTATVTGERPYRGKRSALIARQSTQETEAFGNLMQSFSAAPYRNQRVRVRAAVRAEVSGPDNQAQLWLHVDCKGDQRGFFDNMSDRPITASAWREYEIAGDVAADAETINLGLMLIGSGRVWLDAVSFERLGVVSETHEPPRPLQDRGLDGSQHHGVGIVPTAPVSRTVRGVREGRDELLERAVEIVNR